MSEFLYAALVIVLNFAEVSIADTDDDTDDTNITPEPKVIKEPKVLKDPTEDPVIYLNDITFPTFIEQHQLVLVDFVTPEYVYTDRNKIYHFPQLHLKITNLICNLLQRM